MRQCEKEVTVIDVYRGNVSIYNTRINLNFLGFTYYNVKIFFWLKFKSFLVLKIRDTHCILINDTYIFYNKY